MTTGLSLVTRGLLQPNGLSLVTEGLLALSELSFNIPVVAPPQLVEFQAAQLQVDVRLGHELFETDISVVAGDLASDRGLQTALLLSLFVDRRASREELERFGMPLDDPRGWWGDNHPEVEGDQYGSKLWLLERAKQTQDTLNFARETSRESTEWMFEDGVVTERVQIDAAYPARGLMALGVVAQRPNTPAERYAFVWEV